MYWDNNQESVEEIASTRSSTPPTLSKADIMYHTNPTWAEENLLSESSAPSTSCDMYWSNNSKIVSIGCSVPTLSANRPYGPSSCNNVSTLEEHTAKEGFQSVLNVRKCWKTLPGGEAVWPPALEAALIEGKSFPRKDSTPLTGGIGLEHYQPEDCRETRMLGRFPMRNCFIAEYIFRTTGKRRSAKQVGSRLQQIRESCRDEKLLRLLSPMRQTTYVGAFPSSNTFYNPPSHRTFAKGSSIRHTAVHVNILSEGATEAESNHMWMEAEVSVRPARRLSSINPAVAFSSPALIEAESRSTVYVADRIVHTETTPLALVGSGQPPGFIYSTKLVPKYWEVISKNSDPTRFTVYQEVFKSVDSTLIFSGTYTFEYPTENSSGSSSPVDIPYSDSNHLVSAAPTQQFHGEQYPLYVPPEWRPSLPSHRYPAAPHHTYSNGSSTYPLQQ
ncbi:TEA domain-containing protein [Mycena sanguinolenta]|uniref:TEA domain-containing protein n=1 Tax=Mycena sanguinolenta TaxID=230812 RepID=A0A8H6Z9X8_9AGAR|nr:TEA domain-containing protein [Mycena sanguinolenta]